MADTDQDQKTELPTEKRLQEAAEQGQFAKSADLQVLIMLAAALAAVAFTIGSSAESIGAYTVGIFNRFTVVQLQPASVISELGQMLRVAGGALTPLLVACVIAALLAGGLQSGFRLSPKAIMPKLEKLDPTKGFGRIFSKASLVHAGIDLLKLIAIGTVLYFGARTLMEDPLFSSPVEAAYLGEFLRSATTTFFSRLLFALGVIAALSYGYEKFKTGKGLMMTRQEVKDERRNSDGDPNVKGAMRRMARRLMQKQMLAAVATADVVVTNPTHYAVALRYERGQDQAPVILAKGENRFARRIKEVAAEHGVPMVENRPVARLLYAMGKVGEGIPAELYQAVAEILAVVYRTHRYYFHQLRQRRLEAAATAPAAGARPASLSVSA